MSERKCATCGEPEQRTATTVNLDPVFSLCVACLVAFAKETRETPVLAPDYDGRMRQTGERE